MKITVDEHIPLMTVRALQDLGHDIRDIHGTADEGMQDEELWEMVQREERLLITTDKGFTRYRATHHYGILVEWPGLLVVMRDVAQSIWRRQGNGRA